MIVQPVRVRQIQAKSGNLEIWKSIRLKLPDHLGKSLTALPFFGILKPLRVCFRF
jgi:hypothetical protein